MILVVVVGREREGGSGSVGVCKNSWARTGRRVFQLIVVRAPRLRSVAMDKDTVKWTHTDNRAVLSQLSAWFSTCCAALDSSSHGSHQFLKSGVTAVWLFRLMIYIFFGNALHLYRHNWKSAFQNASNSTLIKSNYQNSIYLSIELSVYLKSDDHVYALQRNNSASTIYSFDTDMPTYDLCDFDVCFKRNAMPWRDSVSHVVLKHLIFHDI